MSKIAVVYWSGTGNTEAMAKAVVYGANSAGAAAELLTCGDFNADRMDEFDAVAFGLIKCLNFIIFKEKNTIMIHSYQEVLI